MLYTLFFFSSKCSLFHNANLFGSCIIHILYTGCAKIKENNSGARVNLVDIRWRRVVKLTPRPLYSRERVPQFT